MATPLTETSRSSNVASDFAVVLKLSRRDGTKVDLVIRPQDDARELAENYVRDARLPTRAVELATNRCR